MSNQDIDYGEYQHGQFRRFEGICKQCGECCGSHDGDPCANLAKEKVSGKYYCKDYENRFGPRRTLSGKIFNCVSIRDIKIQGHLRPNCAYNSIR